MKKKSFIQLLATALLFISITSCFTTIKHSFVKDRIEGIATIQELDKAAVFSFAIMSDNKGDALPKAEFTNMVNWIKDADDAFVIGLGDHVKKGWENDFLPFLSQDAWWHNNFYPNVADGENEYYGKSQADWGAGAPILDMVHLSERPHVKIRKNGCEYYTQIEIKGYRIHLIQLHYSDSPADADIAFNESSRAYLINTLKSIHKGKHDIIIVAAHSHDGFWLDELSKERQAIVAEKADLLLSATTHFFTRNYLPEYENSGALCINTGSITHPFSYCPAGYVEVHVLENPFSLLVQYIDASETSLTEQIGIDDYAFVPKREMQYTNYAWIKLINGPIFATHFRKPRKDEDLSQAFFELNSAVSKEELRSLIQKTMCERCGTDEAYTEPADGLPAGKVDMRNLWKVFPYNNKIYILYLTAEEVKQVFDDKIALEGRKQIKLAINSYNGTYLIKHLGIPDDRWEKSNFNEIQMLLFQFIDSKRKTSVRLK